MKLNLIPSTKEDATRPKDPRTDVMLYLESDNFGNVVLRAKVGDRSFNWYVLAITPSGTVKLYSGLGHEAFQTDRDNGGTIVIEEGTL